MTSDYEPLAYQLHLLYDKTPPEERNTAKFWREVAKHAVEFLKKEVPHV